MRKEMRISRSNRWRRSGGKREEARGERKNGRRASREGGGGRDIFRQALHDALKAFNKK